MPKAEKSLRTYLHENIGILTIESALKVLIDIVEALVAMEETVVHRDIKPENILLLNGEVVSFGLWHFTVRGGHHGRRYTQVFDDTSLRSSGGNGAMKELPPHRMFILWASLHMRS